MARKKLTIRQKALRQFKGNKPSDFSREFNRASKIDPTIKDLTFAEIFKRGSR